MFYADLQMVGIAMITLGIAMLGYHPSPTP
jgi:hypothetical protein